MEKENKESKTNYLYNTFVVSGYYIFNYDLKGLEINVFSIIMQSFDFIENKHVVSSNYIAGFLREDISTIDEIIDNFLKQKKLFGYFKIENNIKKYYLKTQEEESLVQYKKEKKSDIPKYLYILKSDHKIHSYKIGITQDLNTRIKTLSRNKDIPNITLYKSWFIKNTLNVEKYIKNKYSNSMKYEWFSNELSIDKVILDIEEQIKLGGL